MKCGSRFDNACGKGGTRSFAEPHVQIKQRLLADPLQQCPMRRFGRAMASHAMIERRRIGFVQNRRGGRCNVAVEENRHAIVTRSQNGASHGRLFAAAQSAQQFERIAKMVAVQRDGALDCRNFALQPFGIDARAGTDPVLCLAAIQAMADGGGNRGVADTHLADAEKNANDSCAVHIYDFETMRSTGPDHRIKAEPLFKLSPGKHLGEEVCYFAHVVWNGDAIFAAGNFVVPPPDGQRCKTCS